MRIVRSEGNAKKNILSDLLKRDSDNYDSYTDTVQQTMNDVKERQDVVVFKYTARFDGVVLDASNVRVTEAEIEEVMGLVEPSLLEVMKKSMKDIRDCHQRQVQHSWFGSKPDGTILGQKVTALESAGVYMPGGKAAYPSPVLMNIIPTEAVGAKHIAMATPSRKDGEVNPATLTATHLAGATEIYKVGGAQAVAALASGTESIPRANKIVGPGNIFVALAKKAVYGYVNIDSIAGPSETLVLADEMANLRFVAAGLLSQAEHDELVPAILVTTSMELVGRVPAQADEFVKELPRKEILEKLSENFGYIPAADNTEDVIGIANKTASEHLEIVTKNPLEVMTKIQNVGIIFIGEYSSEPLGDYFTGPDHVLPTNGTARFFSPLGIDDFIKKFSITYYSREASEPVHKDIITFAKVEQLTAYVDSTKVRFEE